jgi:ParB/RepB/Spo0J family partition protein
MKILIVDDDPRIREALVTGLQLQWPGAELFEAADGDAGLRQFFDTNPDLVLLDVTMPRMSGFEVLKEIRRASQAPVILLTARGEEMDQVRGLELGADDYLVKPIKHAALMARVRVLLRRIEHPPPAHALPDFVAGDLAIDFAAHEVTVRGERVPLTPVEYKLLYQLVRNAGHLLSHRALMERVWGIDYEASPEYLKVFISRLRAKLRRPRSPEYIQTERGLGYRFISLPQPNAATPEELPRVGGEEAASIVWLAIDQIDPSPDSRNSRRVYDQGKLRELADSIREYGILQPILVVPVGDRFEVIAGHRRLQASLILGLDHVPAIVRPDLEESRRLLINLVENAQRVDLSPTERIAAVRQLALAGLGVREIARGTGLSPGTVSRWIRMAGNKPLLRALEDGRIDLFRAMHLARIQDETLLGELIALAPEYAPDTFYSLVQQRVAGSNTFGDRDERRLAVVAERLMRVQAVTPRAIEYLKRIVDTASTLLAGAQVNGGAPSPVGYGRAPELDAAMPIASVRR